jgi:hypothetical protein
MHTAHTTLTARRDHATRNVRLARTQPPRPPEILGIYTSSASTPSLAPPTPPPPPRHQPPPSIPALQYGNAWLVLLRLQRLCLVPTTVLASPLPHQPSMPSSPCPPSPLQLIPPTRHLHPPPSPTHAIHSPPPPAAVTPNPHHPPLPIRPTSATTDLSAAPPLTPPVRAVPPTPPPLRTPPPIASSATDLASPATRQPSAPTIRHWQLRPTYIDLLHPPPVSRQPLHPPSPIHIRPTSTYSNAPLTPSPPLPPSPIRVISLSPPSAIASFTW